MAKETKIIGTHQFQCRGIDARGDWAFDEKDAPTAIVAVHEDGRTKVFCLCNLISSEGKCNYDYIISSDTLNGCPYDYLHD
jgi:hypothetical protein